MSECKHVLLARVPQPAPCALVSFTTRTHGFSDLLGLGSLGGDMLGNKLASTATLTKRCMQGQENALPAVECVTSSAARPSPVRSFLDRYVWPQDLSMFGLAASPQLDRSCLRI